jgi:hypothetical protein
LIIGGLLKITYDLLLLGQFASQRPPEELVTTASGTPASAQR